MISKKIVVIPQPWFDKDDYGPEDEALFWNGGIGKAYKEKIETYFTSRVISVLMRRIEELTRKVAEQESVFDLIDIRRELPSSPEYYMDQFHFTPQGSEIVAERIASRLASLLSK